MQYTRSEFLDRVLEGYRSGYELFKPEKNQIPDGLPLVACAVMHISEASYIFTKRAEMWSVNSHEYVWFFSTPKLSAEIARHCIRYAHEEGMKKIDPNKLKNHMCTRLVAVFFCDTADDDTVTVVKKCNIHKSFQFSLKGWMEFHAVSVDLGKGSVASNRYGIETANFMKSVLNPVGRKKGRDIWDIIRRISG